MKRVHRARRIVRTTLILSLALLVAAATGCSGSSHRIATVNGKTSAKFSNKSVPDVVAVLTKDFEPLKGYTADIPQELQDKKINLEFSDATTADPVLKGLADATGYQVSSDAGQRKILFVAK